MMLVTRSTRAEIIARFRQRIAEGSRTRLPKDELQALIEAFLELLQGAKTKTKIQGLCEAELALLEEGYPQPTVAKVYLPKYRNAIRAAMADGELPMTERTSRLYDYQKRTSGEEGVALDHLALAFLKYDQQTYLEIAGQSAERNNAKQDELKPVNPEVFLERARMLLNSQDPFELAVGLAAVTGRRFSEVMDKGGLETTGSRFWVRFSGQLKKRGVGEMAFLTPCLLPADEVVEALQRLRQHPRIAPLAGKSVGELNRSLANSVKRVVVKQFEETGIVPVLENEAGVTIHNLRGIYGEICVHYFCPPSRGVARFVQERLGHVISEQELKRANAGATQHYFHYYLVDGAGKHLGERGVLLAEMGAAPGEESLEQEIDAPVLDEPVMPLPEGADDIPAMAEPTPTSDSGDLARQVAVLSQDLHRLWGLIEQRQGDPVPSPTAAVGQQELEGLHAQLREAEQERDQAVREVSQVRAELARLQSQFQAERGAFQKRVDGLTELLKSTPVTPAGAPGELTQLTLGGLEDNTSQPKTRKPTSKRTSASKLRGSADRRVETALHAIIEWNQNQRRHDQKFAITQSILQRCTGSNMPAVRRVMNTFQNEIFDHNATHTLDPNRHNVHKDLKPIKEFILKRL
jgi:integrase